MNHFKEYAVRATFRLVMSQGTEPNVMVLSETIESAVRKAGVNVLVGPVATTFYSDTTEGDKQ